MSSKPLAGALVVVVEVLEVRVNDVVVHASEVRRRPAASGCCATGFVFAFSFCQLRFVDGLAQFHRRFGERPGYTRI